MPTKSMKTPLTKPKLLNTLNIILDLKSSAIHMLNPTHMVHLHLMTRGSQVMWLPTKSLHKRSRVRSPKFIILLGIKDQVMIMVAKFAMQFY